MNSTQIRHLTEAYQEIYSGNSPIFIHEEIELLSDEQLDIVVEGAVIELIEEGYTLEDINEAFEDFDESLIVEAKGKVTGRTGNKKFSGDAAYKDMLKSMDSKPSEKKKESKTQKLKPSPSPKTTKSSKTTDSDHSDAVRRSKNAAMGRALASSSRVKKSVSKVTGNVSASGKYKPRATDRPNTPTSSSSSKKGIKINNIRKRVSGAISKAGDKFNKAAEKTGKSFASVSKKVQSTASGTVKKAGDAANSAARSAARGTDRAEKAVAGKAKQAKSGLKGMIRRAATSVANRASGLARRMSEEYDQYDLVLEFLVDNEIAEDLQEAQWMMVNEVDSEDIATIMEAYGLDEEKGTILSVKGGGKTKYTASKGEQRAAARSAAERANAAQRKRSEKNAANDSRWAKARKKSAENMNTKLFTGSVDDGEDAFIEPGERGYGEKRTDRAARARRASGR